MGWASTLEDIVERLTSDLEAIKRNRAENTVAVDDGNKLEALIRTCERFLADVNKHLEVATAPELELADELIRSERENGRLRAQVQELERTKKSLAELSERYSELEKAFMTANANSAKRYARIKEVEADYKRLEKSHSRMRKAR